MTLSHSAKNQRIGLKAELLSKRHNLQSESNQGNCLQKQIDLGLIKQNPESLQCNINNTKHPIQNYLTYVITEKYD